MQETDPTTALASSNVAYIAGQVDMSRQLFDFARPGFDLVLAADLGADLDARVDVQAVQGTNANGQTLGLANVGGIVSVSYTDASPTAAELDPCATAENAKCRRYFTREDDGLSQEWAGRVFMNPPYGREAAAPQATVVLVRQTWRLIGAVSD